MAKDWEKLSGETGQEIETGRFRRALKLGKLVTQVTGSAIRSRLFGSKSTESPAQKDPSMPPVERGVWASAAIKNAGHVVDTLGQMKGAAMKLGQILSTDPELVSPEFAERLSVLQRNAPPMTYKVLCEQIESAFDRPIHDLFHTFDPVPLGAASIGQVHRAILFDGREVAVKIQYPKIVESLDSDIKKLSSLLTLARVFTTKARVDSILEEVRETLLREADYSVEAASLVEFRSAASDFMAMQSKSTPKIVVPELVPEFSCGTVLTMEYVKGEKLDAALPKLPTPQARSELIERFLRLFMYLFHERQLLHGDPHPGNFLVTPEGNLALLDYGCVRRVPVFYTDGVLRVVRAFWRDDMPNLMKELDQLGFAAPGMEWPTEEVLRGYFKRFLKPIAEDEPFNFAKWPVFESVSTYVMHNMSLKRLLPPRELMLYFRVVAGLKGLLTRLDVDANLHRIARDACDARHIA